MLERILSRENLNRACKRVKANKGAPGIDGMTVEQALPWLREQREELLETMEETREEGKEPDAAWDTGMAGVGGEQLSESLLAHGEEWLCTEGTLKRKTRTGGIL